LNKRTKHDYLTPKEVAERLGKSRFTVYNWINEGKIDATKIGGSWRVPLSSVIKYLGKEAAEQVGLVQ
jgi:excisionase family DNA binding protein